MGNAGGTPAPLRALLLGQKSEGLLWQSSGQHKGQAWALSPRSYVEKLSAQMTGQVQAAQAQWDRAGHVQCRAVASRLRQAR